MTLLEKTLLLAAAGGLGTLARVGVSVWATRLVGSAYPWGTSAVNILGCFLFGLVWALAEKGLPGGSGARYIVLTGFMGAFTTFSTYLFETHSLIASGRVGLALLNLVLQNLLGIGAVVAAMALGRLL